jgi:hypothetical protein
VLAAAPDAVIEVVVFPNQSQSFVRIVPVEALAVFAFSQGEAPVLDIDVLMSMALRCMNGRSGEWDGSSVKVWSQVGTDDGQESRCQVCMRCDDVSGHAFSYSWAAHYKWNVDVLFKAAFFAGLETMLANMVAIVGGVEDVSILQNIMGD